MSRRIIARSSTGSCYEHLSVMQKYSYFGVLNNWGVEITGKGAGKFPEK